MPPTHWEHLVSRRLLEEAEELAGMVKLHLLKQPPSIIQEAEKKVLCGVTQLATSVSEGLGTVCHMILSRAADWLRRVKTLNG